MTLVEKTKMQMTWDAPALDYRAKDLRGRCPQIKIFSYKELCGVPKEKSHRAQAITQEYSSKHVPKAEFKQS